MISPYAPARLSGLFWLGLRRLRLGRRQPYNAGSGLSTAQREVLEWHLGAQAYRLSSALTQATDGARRKTFSFASVAFLTIKWSPSQTAGRWARNHAMTVVNAATF